MKNQLLQRALNSLAHPISLGAAVILLLNALVWQRFWPSWWTGKIGDFAWLVIVPFLVTILLVLCFPAVFTEADWAGKSAIFITGLGFSLIKAVPLLNAFVVTLISNVGFTPKLLVDPSDLIALTALFITWLIWKNTDRVTTRPITRFSALVFTLLAVIADSPAPVQYGEVCLVERAGVIYGFSQAENPASYFGRGPYKYWNTAYSSSDDGATWSQAISLSREEQDQTIDCSQASWPVEVKNADGSISQLSFVNGQGIYFSEDQGETLHLEQRLSEIYSALLVPSKGNLIIAAGTQGIYVRTQQGEWFEVTHPNK